MTHMAAYSTVQHEVKLLTSLCVTIEYVSFTQLGANESMDDLYGVLVCLKSLLSDWEIALTPWHKPRSFGCNINLPVRTSIFQDILLIFVHVLDARDGAMAAAGSDFKRAGDDGPLSQTLQWQWLGSF